MAPFVISASGVRGVVGKGLTPEIVVSLSSAFGSLRKGKILVGYDTRTSNQMFKCAAFSGLLSVGCEVVDAGVCPTPSLQFMVKEGDFQGGIAITGSHNPVEWNALKFIRNDGLFLFPEEGERLIKIHEEKDFSRVSWNALGKISKDKSAIERHIGRILEVVNVEKIRKKCYKEIIDVVELFMDLMSNKNFSENEIIIALNNLAYNGLLEINTVTSLGNMYGGKDKNTLIASDINNNCPLYNQYRK